MAEKGASYAWDPVGTGPFVFESRVPNREATIRANDKYWGGAPAIKKAVYHIVTDTNAQVIGLENGEYDLVYSQIREQAVADRLKRAGFQETRVHRNLPQVLMMNVTVKPFDSLKVRQAIAHSIDRKPLIELGYNGIVTRSSPVPRGYPYVTENVPRYEHDIQKAKQRRPRPLSQRCRGHAGQLRREQARRRGARRAAEACRHHRQARGPGPAHRLGRLFRGHTHFAIHCCVRQPAGHLAHRRPHARGGAGDHEVQPGSGPDPARRGSSQEAPRCMSRSSRS